MTDVRGFFMKVVIAVLVSLMLCMAAGGWLAKNKYDNKVEELQNAVARLDRTNEVQRNVYEKLVIQMKDLESLLPEKDKQIELLKKELAAKKQEILTLNQVVVKWKTAYEALVEATQNDIVDETGTTRTKVEFEKDFGYIGVKGHTLTNPPEAWVKVQQNRPLVLTLAVTQDENKTWHSYVTSSEDNMSVDIVISGVDPYMMRPKWYESIGVTGTAALGTTDAGLGGMFSVGLLYGFGKYELGPAVFFSFSDRVDKFVGLNFIYHPFQR